MYKTNFLNLIISFFILIISIIIKCYYYKIFNSNNQKLKKSIWILKKKNLYYI